MKRNGLTALVLKTARWGLMSLALCLAWAPAYAADEMANTLVYAGENEDTINPLLNNHQELPTIIFSGLMKYDAKGQPNSPRASPMIRGRTPMPSSCATA